jgi:hypothetical protein
VTYRHALAPAMFAADRSAMLMFWVMRPQELKLVILAHSGPSSATPITGTPCDLRQVFYVLIDKLGVAAEDPAGAHDCGGKELCTTSWFEQERSLTAPGQPL